MLREVIYVCSNCGRRFGSKIDCQTHEDVCKNRSFIANNYKLRLVKYIEYIRAQGFVVSATVNDCVCLVSVIDRSKK